MHFIQFILKILSKLIRALLMFSYSETNQSERYVRILVKTKFEKVRTGKSHSGIPDDVTRCRLQLLLPLGVPPRPRVVCSVPQRHGPEIDRAMLQIMMKVTSLECFLHKP